jgi:hypothetical protein
MRRLGVLGVLAVLLALTAGTPSASAAKAKKCKPVSNSAVTVNGIYAKGIGCRTARRFGPFYATTPSKEEAAIELGLRCGASPIEGVAGAFRVKCFNATGRAGRSLRFKYRPS